MRLTIEIHPRSEPIAGWMQLEKESRREFVGMLELISLLEEVRERPPPATAGSRAPGAA